MRYSFDENTKVISILLDRNQHCQLLRQQLPGRAMMGAISLHYERIAKEHGACEIRIIVENDR